MAGASASDPQRRFGGMTTLERLVEADLLGDFDLAVGRSDRARLAEILESVGMKDEALATINAVLANPKRYGYPR